MHCGSRNSFRRFYLYILLLSCFSSVTLAGSLTDDLSINGFFTFDATYINRAQSLVGSGGDARSYDSDKISLKNSLLGAQLDYRLTSNLSIYVQGIATYNNDNDFTVRMDWTYLNYDLGDDAYLRAGQFQIPFLQGTELRNIGVSRIWVRPLIPDSGASGFNTYLGVEYLKHLSTDNAYWDFQVGVGQADHTSDEVDNKNMEVFSVRYSIDNFWLRSAFMHADYSVYTPQKLLITDSGKVLMASFEAEWNVRQFVFNGGYSTSRSDITPDDTSHYLSLGYQWGDFTPYILTSLRSQYFETFVPPVPEDSQQQGSPPMPPDGDADNRSVAIGVRWNMTEHLVVKSQFEHIQLHDASQYQGPVITADSNAFTLTVEGAF